MQAELERITTHSAATVQPQPHPRAGSGLGGHGRSQLDLAGRVDELELAVPDRDGAERDLGDAAGLPVAAAARPAGACLRIPFERDARRVGGELDDADRAVPQIGPKVRGDTQTLDGHDLVRPCPFRCGDVQAVHLDCGDPARLDAQRPLDPHLLPELRRQQPRHGRLQRVRKPGQPRDGARRHHDDQRNHGKCDQAQPSRHAAKSSTAPSAPSVNAPE